MTAHPKLVQHVIFKTDVIVVIRELWLVVCEFRLKKKKEKGKTCFEFITMPRDSVVSLHENSLNMPTTWPLLALSGMHAPNESLMSGRHGVLALPAQKKVCTLLSLLFSRPTYAQLGSKK